MRQSMLTFGLFVFTMGCQVHLHPYNDYLNQSVGHANHDAIAEKMGAPSRVVSLDKGGDVWTYEYCAPGGAAASPSPAPLSPTCQNLNLVFDKSGNLARWHEQYLSASP